MLLILSEAGDQSTNDVIDWLDTLGVCWTRLNGNCLESAEPFAMQSGGDDGECGRRLGPPADAVSAVWLRRWRNPMGDVGPELLDRRTIVGEPIAFYVNLSEFRNRELRSLGTHLFRRYRACKWLGDPATTSLHKLHVLDEAQRCGLDVPRSLVTNSRAALQRFAAEHDAIITKPIAEVAVLLLDDAPYLTYTTRCTREDIAAMPTVFFPALFQEEVAKACELRVFVLGESLHAMAMFSQARSSTALDFRRYNDADPTRCVPYRLPQDVGERLLTLMRRLGLTTGSIDLIVTPDDHHVFLEINPIGQFGMTSQPCNYQLERRIAEHLRRLAHDEES